MNQIKIGKFIAECRKNKKLTQAQLAEQLGITDRAVSKWETGKSMPDASIMLDLCNILGISVNELLCGEVIEMENYSRKAEEQLLEMAKREERCNKRLIHAMYLLVIISSLALITIITLTMQFVSNETLQHVICAITTILFVITVFYAVKLEKDVGYYECKNCHHKYVPSYMTVMMAAHMGTTRKMRCPQCGEKTWSKKVMSK